MILVLFLAYKMTMKHPQKSLLTLFCATLCSNLYAQEHDQTRNHSHQTPHYLVTVSARGVAEDWLDTPFVVDTIYADKVENAHLKNAEDILRSEPSGSIHNGGNVAYSSLWMRGTGSLSITNLDDNSVDFRVDGISNGKTGLVRNLIDIEQVEIAKGPQGTLLGSDAEAGSISIKTVDPEDAFDARLGLAVGNLHQKGFNAMLNVPLNQNIAFRIAGMSAAQDNYLIKKEDQKPLNTQKNQGIQAKLGWHDDAKQNEVVLGVYHDAQTNHVPLLQKDFSHYRVASFDLPHASENTADGVTLNIKSDVHFAQLSSVTAYHKYKGEIARPYLPPEMLPLQYQMLKIPAAMQPTLNGIFARNINNRQRLHDDYKQLSQELRLASHDDSQIKWVTGVYFENKKRHFHNDAKLSLNELPNANPIKKILTTTAGNGDLHKNSNSSAQALFGEITYPVFNQLALIAGARLSHEKLTHDVRWIGNSNNALATTIKTDSQTLSDTTLTGRVGLNYQLTPNWRLYGLQSRGHKMGGFGDYETNVVYGQPLAPYQATVINASEIGSKFQSDDARFKMGMAIYQNTMKNDHISLGGLPPVYKTESANVDSRSRGLEMNVDWQTTEQFKLYADATLLNTKITHVPQAVVARKIAKEGNQMPQVPKVSASIGIERRGRVAFLPQGEWFSDVNYRYVGSRYAQADNVQNLDAYHLLNAKIGVNNDHHALSIWGQNLTDKKYLYIGVQPGNVGTLAPGRTFGMGYAYYF